MKFELEHIICFLIFIAYNYMCLADNGPEEEQPSSIVSVGAFFHESYTQARLVFDYTFYRVNFKGDNLNYESVTQIISPIDTFESGQLMCRMSEEGVAAVVGPPSIKTAPLVESICSNLGIPHLQISWRPSASANAYSDSSTLLNFFPKPELLIKGIGVMAEHLHWKSFVVLYQNADSLIKIQNILKLQNFASNAKQNDIMIKELGPGPNYKSILKKVRKYNERRFVLECETENIIEILQQAKEVKLLESFHQYFITALDAHTVDLSVLDTTANITTIRIIDPENADFRNAVRDLQRYTEIKNINIDLEPYSVKTEAALMYDALNLFIETAKEYDNTYGPVETENLQCFGEKMQWSQGVTIASMMRNINGTFGISGPIEFDAVGSRTNFTLYLVEGNRNDTQATWNPWNEETITFLQSEEDRLSARLRNIEKGVLIVSSRLQAPYLRKKKNAIGDDKYEGFSFDLIKALAEELKSHQVNITFKFEVKKNLGYGNYVEENKTWDGIVGEILAGRAQLGICDLTITHQRREVVDFSSPFMRLGISILHKNPEEKPINTFAFLEPFNTDLWIYIATIYLATTIAFYFVTRMSPPDWENPNPKDENPEELENIWDLKNSLWLSLGTIMNQGCDIVPKGISSRMAAAMWWFFAIIVTNTYIANLTAFLTVANMGSTISNAEDLAKQTKIKYGVLKRGSTEAFFRDSNYSTYQKMWTAMLQANPTVFEESNEEGVNRVLNTKQGLYAYLMESTTLEYNLYTNCDLRKVGDLLDSKGYGIAMPLDYPLRSKINSAILTMQEQGIINKLKDRWWKEMRDDPICPSKTVNKDANLSLKELAGIFLVLGIGVALAYVIAICEFLWNVRNVSVEEHISYWQALKVELLFAVNIWLTKKRAKPVASESSSARSEGMESKSKSIARSVMHGAESLFGLNMLKNESLSRKND